MKIAIFGAGGVGAYFGGRLAQAGADVHLLARGAHLHALLERGLRVHSPNGDRELRLPATDRPEDIGPTDYVLFCVKSLETERAAARLGPLLKEGTAVISLQNGVDNEEKIARIIDRDHVVGGWAFIMSTPPHPRRRPRPRPPATGRDPSGRRIDGDGEEHHARDRGSGRSGGRSTASRRRGPDGRAGHEDGSRNLFFTSLRYDPGKTDGAGSAPWHGGALGGKAWARRPHVPSGLRDSQALGTTQRGISCLVPRGATPAASGFRRRAFLTARSLFVRSLSSARRLAADGGR